MADSILQVSVSANRQIFEDLKRRKPAMCQAMKDLMKDEIAEEREISMIKTWAEAVKNLMATSKKDAEEAMNMLCISAANREKIKSLL
jgi:hypothetical protein